MADYLGVYSDDFGGKTFIRLQVYSVVNNTRQNTNFRFDADYLPDVFKRFVRPFERNSPNCQSTITPRYAKLYLNGTDYLHVDIPFAPGTSEYDQFFIAVSFDPSIVTVGIEGERIPTTILRFKADARG
jgi:hypothetical protein